MSGAQTVPDQPLIDNPATHLFLSVRRSARSPTGTVTVIATVTCPVTTTTKTTTTTETSTITKASVVTLSRWDRPNRSPGIGG